MSKARNSKNFTPLLIVTAFLAVTELVAGIVATQTWGFLQGALVFFVVLFPILVGGAFFLILWSRPDVFNPPSDDRDAVSFTPLLIVMTFLTVTELVAGVVATQTWGFLQGALVFFLVLFPVLVGGAFFLILWSRPNIFYPTSKHDQEIGEV